MRSLAVAGPASSLEERREAVRRDVRRRSDGEIRRARLHAGSVVRRGSRHRARLVESRGAASLRLRGRCRRPLSMPHHPNTRPEGASRDSGVGAPLALMPPPIRALDLRRAMPWPLAPKVPSPAGIPSSRRRRCRGRRASNEATSCSRTEYVATRHQGTASHALSPRPAVARGERSTPLRGEDRPRKGCRVPRCARARRR